MWYWRLVESSEAVVMNEIMTKLMALVEAAGKNCTCTLVRTKGHVGECGVSIALAALPDDWREQLDAYADTKYAGMVQAFEFERGERLRLEAAQSQYGSGPVGEAIRRRTGGGTEP